MRFYIKSSLVLLTLFLLGCYSDKEDLKVTEVPDPPLLTVEAAPLIRVTNLEGSALVGAKLVSLDQELITDRNGVVKTELGLWPSGSTGVWITQDGFLTGRYSTHFFAGGVQWTEYTLFEAGLVQRGSAIKSETFDFDGDLKLVIESESIINDNGDVFREEYNTSFRKLDAQEREIWQAENLPNVGGITEVYGIDLTDQRGDFLNVLDSVLVTIPSVDDDQKIYVQNSQGKYIEGRPFRTDNENTEIFLEQVGWIAIGSEERSSLVSGKITDDLGVGLSHMEIQWTNQRNGDVQRTRTTVDGEYKVRTSDDMYTMEILTRCSDNALGKEVEGSEIAGVHVFELDPQEFFTPNGKVLDCDKNSFTSGYIWTAYLVGGEIYPIDENGNYKGIEQICSNMPIEFTTYDYGQDQPIKSESIFPAANGDNLDFYACERNVITEAVIEIGQEREIFSKCNGSIDLNGNEYEKITFLIESDKGWDEMHIYEVEIANGNSHWTTESLFLQQRFSPINVMATPIVEPFSFRGQMYLKFKYSGIQFEDSQSSDSPLGSVLYTIQI